MIRLQLNFLIFSTDTWWLVWVGKCDVLSNFWSVNHWSVIKNCSLSKYSRRVDWLYLWQPIIITWHIGPRELIAEFSFLVNQWENETFHPWIASYTYPQTGSNCYRPNFMTTIPCCTDKERIRGGASPNWMKVCVFDRV